MPADTGRWNAARCDSWRVSFVRVSLTDEAIDEVTGPSPNGRPFREHAAALVGNAVVAAGWPGIRRDDAAGQEIRGRQGTQLGINRPFLEDRRAFVGACQPFGDFVAVKIFGRLIENREQHQPNQASVQVLLKFSAIAIVHKPILYSI